MKRLLLAPLALLFGVHGASAQWGNGLHTIEASTAPCSQATAYLARNTGSPPTALLTTLICGIVADGDYSGIDFMYVLATSSAANANLNVISSSNTLAARGGNTTPTFTATKGYQGNGTTDCLDTGFNPRTAAGNQTLNSVMYATWALTSPSGTSQSGSYDLTTAVAANTESTGTLLAIYANDLAGGGFTPGGGPGSTIGFAGLSRANSTQVLAMSNASQTTLTQNSVAIPNADYLVTCLGPSIYETEQLSFYMSGGALSGAALTRIYNRVHAYMQAEAGVP